VRLTLLKSNMKKQLRSKGVRFPFVKFSFAILISFACLFSTQAKSQTTVSTNFTNNNGSSAVSFNFVNNNAFAVIISDVASITGTSGANTGQLWYKPGAIAGPPGQITVANGWTQAASQAFTGVANTTTNVPQTMLTNVNLTIPAGMTYGLVYTCTSLRYSTLTAGTYTFTGGGCNIVTGTSIGYGGTLTAMSNTPRGFLGSITFGAAVPCAGSPNPGNTLASANPVCPNTNFTLSLQTSQGTGTTFQWQSSPDGVTWTNIAGATNATYITNISTATYYQCIVTCTNSSLTTISNMLLVNVGMSASCYCTSFATQTADEEITNVTIENVNNTSNCSTVAPGPGSILARYSNFSSGPGAPAAIQLTQGYTSNLSVTVGSCGASNFTSGLAIFIDLNQDGDFVDAGEKVYSNGAASNINCVPATIVTGTFTTPLSATVGTTYMRIIDAEGYAGNIITPCLNTYGYGETEDYLVTILPAPPFDMGATALVAPANTGCYSGTETVTVTIKNYSNTLIDFSVNPVTVNASVTGPNAMSFTPVIVNTGTLAPLATTNVVITTTYNMTAAGTYVFSASTAITGDGNAGNDAMTSASRLVSGGTFVAAGNGQVCAGSPVDLLATNMTNGGTVQWEESTDNITWTPIAGATTNPYSVIAPDTMFYRAMVCGLHTSTVDTIFPVSVASAVGTNVTRCGPGPVTLTGTGSGTLKWYANSTGGSPLATGTTYSTTVAGTDTFYVENNFENCGTGTPATPTCYPVYSSACSSADFINNFSTTGGFTNISNLNSGCNGAGPSNTTFFAAQTVGTTPGGSFNFSVQSGASWGQGHRIWIDYNNDGDFADAGEDVWNSGASSTAVYSGVITVPSNTNPGPKRIRVMCRYATVPTATDYCATTLSFGEVEEYTLNVCMVCSSVRTPVIATVTAAPAITITAADSSLCGAGSTLLVVSSPNQDYGFTWSPSANLNTTTGDSVMFTVSTAGSYTYYVDANDAISGCLNRDSITISMTDSPTVVASSSNDSICRGVSTNLSTVVNTRSYVVDTVNVYNTNTTYPAPYGNWYWGSHHQFLVTAAELQAAGVTAGPITGLSMFVTGVTATPLSSFSIRMANTTLTTLPSSFTTGSFTNCVFYPSYVPVMGENHHIFSNTFMWNGVDNIIIETCFNNTSFTTNCVVEQVTKPYQASVYLFQDASGVCGNPTVNGTANQRPVFAFDAQTNVLNFSWNPVSGLDNPASASPVATPMSTTSYVVTVTDTISGCMAMDTLDIFIMPTPSPAFGSDTIICSNTPLVLDGTAGPYTWLWQDMSTAQTFTVSAFGNYYVDVVDTTSGCAASDSIIVGVNAAPVFTLGSDVTVCDGTQVTFSGPGGQYTYDWSTLDTTQTISASMAGDYELRVTDSTNACFESDTITLFVNPLPPVALGNDTAICDVNGPVVLTAPAGGYTYGWSDMSTGQTLSVNATGNYYVVVTDTVTNCADGDTIVVTINATPAVMLGNDTTFCSANGPITLVAPAGPYNYQWSDMTTGTTLTTGVSGTYALLVTDSVNGCSASDSIIVNVPATPPATINDTTLCGTAYALMAPITSNASYLWSTGDTTSSIIVNSPGGTFTVTITDNASNCAASDAATVMVNTPPTVTFSMQAAACTTDGIITLTGSPAGGTFSGPGVAGNTFNPATAGAGTFVITYDYTDTNGCSGADSSTIVISPCVGVNDPLVAAGMNVFPNPNNGYFMLTIANANYSEVTIELLSVDGKIVYSDKVSDVKGNYTKELDLATEGNGIYFLRITADGQTFMQKVVKQE
jgi:hypothetical protein